MVFSFQVFLGLVQETNLIQRLINVAYTYDNLAHRYWDPRVRLYSAQACLRLPAVFLFHRVLKAQSDHRSRHEGPNVHRDLQTKASDAEDDCGVSDLQ